LLERFYLFSKCDDTRLATFHLCFAFVGDPPVAIGHCPMVNEIIPEDIGATLGA
jgi:hypothetical protein